MEHFICVGCGAVLRPAALVECEYCGNMYGRERDSKQLVPMRSPGKGWYTVSSQWGPPAMYRYDIDWMNTSNLYFLPVGDDHFVRLTDE